MNYSKVRSGEKLGILTVEREIKTDGKGTHVLCVCQCPRKSQIVTNLASLRRKAKNKSRVPSCGCLTGTPPIRGRERIPKKKLRESSIYSLEYEKARFVTNKTEQTKQKIIAKIGMPAFRKLVKRYGMMKSSCYDKDYVRYKTVGAKGIVLCKEWRDKDKGLMNYVLHFSEKIPQDSEFLIRRINKKKNFSPSNCEVIVKHSEVGQLPKTPKYVYPIRTGTGSGLAFEVRVGKKYLGRFYDLSSAEERLNKYISRDKERSSESHTNTPLYKRWYDLNRRHPDQVCKRWSKEKLGMKGFDNFHIDVAFMSDGKSRMRRIDKTRPYERKNVEWY